MPYGYRFRSIRVYEPDVFDRFTEICKKEYTTPNQVLNKLVKLVVEAGSSKVVL